MLSFRPLPTCALVIADLTPAGSTRRTVRPDPRELGGQKTLRAVRARDGERCKLDEDGTYYGPRSASPRRGACRWRALILDNLAVVCRGHHQQIEAKRPMRPVSREGRRSFPRRKTQALKTIALPLPGLP